ncbi:MAG TPA: hypothetical protein VK789_34060 [Bryobacteraceae bacterium]|jgi:hypothetical protein|nr:hypothetical protein [Bryobacteraceae bacterium]
MEKGISWEVIWFDFDQKLIEIAFACSNGQFSGTCEVYVGRDKLPELANTLKGFPLSGSDTRSVELGTFDPKYADGGVKMDFYCSDSRGHSIVEIKLRGDGCKALGAVESVALRIPIEPSGLDSFLAQVIAAGTGIGSKAFLPMAT